MLCTMGAALLTLSLLAGFVTETVAYGDDVQQQVDVTRRDEAKDLPVVIFLHGGVWQLGDRSQYRNVGVAFAARGFVSVVASYRLAPKYRWPAPADDAAAIVALAKKNAGRWGGDPSQIFVVGHSAGAQLAMVLLYDGRFLQTQGLTPKDLRGVVNLSGVFDLRSALDEDQVVLRAASPLDIAKKTGTPLLFITGPDDYLAMQRQTEAMTRALALLGEDAPVVVVDGRDHFGLVSALEQPGDPTTAAVVKFLLRARATTR